MKRFIKLICKLIGHKKHDWLSIDQTRFVSIFCKRCGEKQNTRG